MPSLTFHRELPIHLSRVGLTTFAQLLEFLLLTRYAEGRLSHLTAGARNDLARADLADAIKRGQRAGVVVEREVVGRGKTPRANLLYDSSTAPDIPLGCSQQLLELWRRVGRKTIKIVYSPQQYMNERRIAAGCTAVPADPDTVTAELALSSLYFDLSSEEQAQWIFRSCVDGLWPTMNSSLKGGEPVVTYIAHAECAHRGIMVPVVCGDDETAFVDFFRWVMEQRQEVTDDPLQIWRPDPETVVF